MLSVVVPVYNEEKAIASTVDQLIEELEGFMEYEIIVVNDGSTDGTEEILKSLNKKNCSHISHPENVGYGRSLQDGITIAKYDCIAIVDADASYPIKDLKKLYSYYPLFDMVVGARQGAEYERGIIKRFSRVVFNFLAEYASGRKVADINSGFRVFRKDLILQNKDIMCSGFSFTTTITLLFMLNHYFVKYIPIEYASREGRSKVKHLRDTLRALQIIVQAILHHNPVKLSLLFATINAVVGMFVFIFNWIFVRDIGLSVFSAVCLALFIPTFCLGLLAEKMRRVKSAVSGMSTIISGEK